MRLYGCDDPLSVLQNPEVLYDKVKNLKTARKTFQLLKMVLKTAGSEIKSEIGEEALDKLQNYQKMFEEPEPIQEQHENEVEQDMVEDEEEDEFDKEDQEDDNEQEEEEELDLAYLFPGMRHQEQDASDSENCTNCSILYGKLQQADEKLQEAREHIALLSKTCMVIADLLDEDKAKVVKQLLPMWTRHFLPFLAESDEDDE
jgi:hypothetical protein